MRKLFRIISIVISLVIIAILIRACQVAGPQGGGGGVVSPDQKFIAEAISLEGEKFWGGRFTYYEFTIKATNGDLFCHYRLDDPPQPLSDWREESEHLIVWETNSSSVTYNFNGGHLNLSVSP